MHQKISVWLFTEIKISLEKQGLVLLSVISHGYLGGFSFQNSICSPFSWSSHSPLWLNYSAPMKNAEPENEVCLCRALTSHHAEAQLWWPCPVIKCPGLESPQSQDRQVVLLGLTNVTPPWLVKGLLQPFALWGERNKLKVAKRGRRKKTPSH